MTRLQKLLFVFLFFITSTVFAFNGAFDYGFSEISKGMGGGGAALPQDAIISAMDPAGVAFIGNRIDVGGSLYLPFMYYNAGPGSVNPPIGFFVAPGRHDSNISAFFLPNIGMSRIINRRSSFDIALYSMAGFGSSYPGEGTASGGSGPFGGGWLHSDLKQAATSITYAHRMGRWSSWGISAIIATQVFDATGGARLAPFSVAPNFLSNKGYDFSIGVGPRLGMHIGFNSHIAVAVSYQPEIFMTKLRDYRGLFPDGGSFNIPPIGVIGLAITPNPDLAFTFDVQKVWSRTIKAYSNPDNTGGSCTFNSGNPSCYGGTNGSGFDWNNTIAYKIGLQWKMNDKLTWRLGFNHNNPNIKPSAVTTNILAPGGVIKDIITAGFTKHVSKGHDLTMFFNYIPPQSITGLNRLSIPTPQTITIHATGFGFGVSYAWV